ncbi:MAG TPA: phosphoribosylaminoimidazolesuccinocarboxamide synthase [Flavobacteriales bacterium]|jgi:phosphoribosylaminoimidazole-succinocarboxamide synthase|nr:phosphoribosylaminoimidazolesuccinocarboxamide synthase [Flavobacteriales bacterium]
MRPAIVETNFKHPLIDSLYRGKVRDVYSLTNGDILLVATDRISAFDHVLPKGIPFKGEVLTSIASDFLDRTSDIVPNWKKATPHPNVMSGLKAEPIKIEMVIRGYLTGHAWRVYRSGGRKLCGVPLPEGMKEHDKFPIPIITPATKAEEGHDEDISREEIIEKGIVDEGTYNQLEEYTRKLFESGTHLAAERGLILVDTKYEFGLDSNGAIVLIDEIHTPDSSRYFYLNTYDQLQREGEPQRQLSKEFVREWLIENGFQGLEGQRMPELPDEFVELVTNRYIELYEKITGNQFDRSGNRKSNVKLEQDVLNYLDSLKA